MIILIIIYFNFFISFQTKIRYTTLEIGSMNLKLETLLENKKNYESILFYKVLAKFKENKKIWQNLILSFKLFDSIQSFTCVSKSQRDMSRPVFVSSNKGPIFEWFYFLFFYFFYFFIFLFFYFFIFLFFFFFFFLFFLFFFYFFVFYYFISSEIRHPAAHLFSTTLQYIPNDVSLGSSSSESSTGFFFYFFFFFMFFNFIFIFLFLFFIFYFLLFFFITLFFKR